MSFNILPIVSLPLTVDVQNEAIKNYYRGKWNIICVITGIIGMGIKGENKWHFALVTREAGYCI